MDLDTIKTTWKSTGEGLLDKKQLSVMATKSEHRYINRIRRRLTVEGVFMLVFILLYYQAFDGNEKPLLVNIVLVVTSIGFVLTRYLGWVIFRNIKVNSSLKSTMLNFRAKLKRIALSTQISAFLFGLSLLLFFIIDLHFSPFKFIILCGMVITLGFLTYFSARVWRERLKAIKQTLTELEL
ncbi:MAG: hypothetical protein AAGA64_17980 [Bacteroidota bacterium]